MKGMAILRYVLSDLCGEESGLFFAVDARIEILLGHQGFVLYLRKPDPRDRPSAADALTHPGSQRRARTNTLTSTFVFTGCYKALCCTMDDGHTSYLLHLKRLSML